MLSTASKQNPMTKNALGTVTSKPHQSTAKLLYLRRKPRTTQQLYAWYTKGRHSSGLTHLILDRSGDEVSRWVRQPLSNEQGICKIARLL